MRDRHLSLYEAGMQRAASMQSPLLHDTSSSSLEDARGAGSHVGL